MIARGFTVTLVALLGMTLALPLGEGMDPVEAKKRFKTITRSFSNGGEIVIPADGLVEGPADPFPSPIQVGGFRKGKVKDVNLVLRDFNHAVPQHVDVLLVAPDGRNAIVMSDAGGLNGVVDITLTLDDEAAAPLSSPLATGAFQPANFGASLDSFFDPAPVPNGNVALSTFDGGGTNGTWQLFVMDDTDSSPGTIGQGWTLEITAKVKKKKK